MADATPAARSVRRLSVRDDGVDGSRRKEDMGLELQRTSSVSGQHRFRLHEFGSHCGPPRTLSTTWAGRSLLIPATRCAPRTWSQSQGGWTPPYTTSSPRRCKPQTVNLGKSSERSPASAHGFLHEQPDWSRPPHSRRSCLSSVLRYPIPLFASPRPKAARIASFGLVSALVTITKRSSSPLGAKLLSSKMSRSMRRKLTGHVGCPLEPDVLGRKGTRTTSPG